MKNGYGQDDTALVKFGTVLRMTAFLVVID
jgi:hypothetical protein